MVTEWNLYDELIYNELVREMTWCYRLVNAQYETLLIKTLVVRRFPTDCDYQTELGRGYLYNPCIGSDCHGVLKGIGEK
jgi:hypothetical protein